MNFFVDLRGLVSWWQKETWLNSYLILNEISLANLTVTLVVQHLIIPTSLMIFAYGLYREQQITLQRQLRESQFRTQLIFENAKDAIFLETVEGQIVDANPAAG